MCEIPSIDLTRVLVVGATCSGKSTLSSRLSTALGVPHVEMDTFCFDEHWRRRPQAEFRRRVQCALTSERWIVDGDYREVRDLVWPSCTAVVWMRPPLIARVFRALVRRFGRDARARVHRPRKLERSRWRESLVCRVLRSGRANRRYGRLETPRHLAVVELRGRSEAVEFLAKVEDRRESPAAELSGWQSRRRRRAWARPLRSLIELPNDAGIVLWRLLAPPARREVHASNKGWVVYAERWDRESFGGRLEDAVVVFSTRELSMLDWDGVPERQCVSSLRSLCSGRLGQDLRFRLYRTPNGYHAFCLSHPFRARDVQSIAWPVRFGCDNQYMLMSLVRGQWSVRMTPKAGRGRPAPISVGDVGEGEPNPGLLELLRCHDAVMGWCAENMPKAWDLHDDSIDRLAAFCRDLDGSRSLASATESIT